MAPSGPPDAAVDYGGLTIRIGNISERSGTLRSRVLWTQCLTEVEIFGLAVTACCSVCPVGSAGSKSWGNIFRQIPTTLPIPEGWWTRKVAPGSPVQMAWTGFTIARLFRRTCRKELTTSRLRRTGVT